MCQIKNINEIKSRSPFSLKLEQLLFSFLRNLKIFLIFGRKIKRFFLRFSPSIRRNKNSQLSIKNSDDLRNKDSCKFKPGDIIRVRSREQILQTLDGNNKLDGCRFLDEMWQYCGTEQKVLKRIDYFYDEASYKLRKTRNTVLLEGLYCSGELPIFKHRCDRTCLLFWKEEWLENVR